MNRASEVRVGLNLEGHYYDVGLLALIDGKIYFEYTAAFLDNGLELSPFKLPLKNGAVFNDDGEFEGLFGLFNDALPDGWGRLLIDRYLRNGGISPEKVTPLDRLLYSGTDAIGALTFEPNHAESIDSDFNAVLDLDLLDKQMKEILDGQAEEVLEALLVLNGSSAGARPKALIQVSEDRKTLIYNDEELESGFEQWLVKFSNSGDSVYSGSIEYAYSLMAKEAGLEMEETHLFKGRSLQRYFGTKRFDRRGDKRMHVHTLCGLIHSDFRVPSLDYDDLLAVTTALTKDVKECEKAYRLACFNVLAHNRDDHEKNVSFLMDSSGRWKLSPAYDLTFSSGPNGWQSMTVMGEGEAPGLKDLKKLADAHEIKHYKKIIDDVLKAVSEWQKFAEMAGVPNQEALLIDKVIGG